MSVLSSLSFLWGQAFLQGASGSYQKLMVLMFLLGEPDFTINPVNWSRALMGGALTWLKVVSLLCLLGWSASWLVAAVKERTVGKGNWLDLAVLVSIIGVVGTVVLRVLEQNGKVPTYRITGTSLYVVQLLALIFGAIFLIWAEIGLWSTIRKVGTKVDGLVLLGVHLALAVGILFGFAVRAANNQYAVGTVREKMDWWQALVAGLRVSGTYMGYVILFRVFCEVLVEVFLVRGRRLFSIALVSIREATRRMWAPYVVIVFFLVILAFTHWFLVPPRPAELGRLYVGTLSLLCSLLLTVMVTLLTPLSLPHDIQHQTIFTVVSKPVRRIELVWGRMLGFMAIVTILVLAFGGISLWYLSRTVGGTIRVTEERVLAARKQGKEDEAKQLQEQASQLRTRMAARVPVKGSLTFLDSLGKPHLRGIDVGQEQSIREPRSHIEGATPATAIWQFGVVPDPLAPEGTRASLLDRRIPVDLMLQPDTLEGLLDETFKQKYRISAAKQRQADPNLRPSEATSLTSIITNAQRELERVEQEHRKLQAQVDDLDRRAAAAERAERAGEAETLKRQSRSLHSPPIALEMTFNVYRTTKGRIGEPVYAEIEAVNPRTGAEYHNIFAIREYYTNRQNLPASLLAGSGGDLRIEIRCVSPTQYLGMAESDLFLLAQSGSFGWNFLRGLFGVWLQAMVLTAIGVFAGTFLSWPVALLTTIAFFVAGEVAFSFLLDFTNSSLQGGGPFESLIRLLAHENLMNDLTPTLSVVAAKALDALVMPVMSRLVYIVPNFSALDVSNTVADGFAVTGTTMVSNLLLAIAYALPFSIAGYFILKHREVAA